MLSDKIQTPIPLSIPNICGNEIKYVTEALKDGWVSTAGPFVTEFERKVAHYVNSNDAVACQNGTSGIHTALMCLNVEQEDIVVVPTLTFIAAVNPVKYVGATPVFMDCDDSLCMDPVKLEAYFEENCEYMDGKLMDKCLKKTVKAIIVVHIFGNMADMEKIVSIAERYNIKVIEDATEAIGSFYISGKYQNKFAGTIGDIGVYSFNGNKIITTGGGGMIVSDNENYIARARHLTTQAKADELYYTHEEIGYNYRMTSIQAAMGLAQLENLEKFIQIKNSNYEIYQSLFNATQKFSLLSYRKSIRSNYWFYALDCSKSGCTRNEIIKGLKIGRAHV